MTTYATVYKHKGPWTASSLENRALRFVHSYIEDVVSDLSLPSSPTKYYAPDAIFFDTTNVTYTGAAAIRTWMLKLFSVLDAVDADPMTMVAVDESADGKALFTVNAEFMFRYFVKGDPVPILVPRLFVFVIADAKTDDAFDGLQFVDIKLYWDTSLLSGEVKRRAAAK